MSDTLTEQPTTPAAASEAAASAVPTPAPVAPPPLRPAPPVPQISGPRKAAILMIALGPTLAGEIMRNLNPRQIDQLTIEMTAAGMISPEEREHVLREFFHTHQAHSYVLEGGIDYAQTVLERAMGTDQAMQIIGKLSAFVQMQPFDFLRRVNVSQIISYLQSEHPQTIALVLAYVPQDVGAQVLAALPPDLQTEVSVRVASMESTDPSVVKQIEAAMQETLDQVITTRLDHVGGVETLVNLIQNVDRGTERRLLEDLDQSNPTLAEEIRKMMFVFEDIVQIDDLDLQKVLRDVDNSTLALALKGAPEELMTKIISNMSERQAENLTDDIKVLGRKRRSEIEEAQSKIVDVIRRLEGDGTITLMRANEEIVE